MGSLKYNFAARSSDRPVKSLGMFGKLSVVYLTELWLVNVMVLQMHAKIFLRYIDVPATTTQENHHPWLFCLPKEFFISSLVSTTFNMTTSLCTSSIIVIACHVKKSTYVLITMLIIVNSCQKILNSTS